MQELIPHHHGKLMPVNQVVKMKINKKNKLRESFLVAGIITLMFCSLVSALGTSSIFSGSHALEAYPGQEVIAPIKLSNPDVEEEVTFKGELLEGNEIASLDQDTYNVPYNGVVTAKITVIIPADASIGQTYHVTHKFSQVEAESGEGVTFAQTFTGGFDVNVVEKPQETPQPEGINLIWWILGIVVLIAVILVIYFLMKSKKEAVK